MRRIALSLALVLAALLTFAQSSGYVRVVTLAGGPHEEDDDHGDNGNSPFREPLAVAVTPGGDVFVADSKHDQIRRVTPAGVVSVYAGTGKGGYKDGPASTAQFRDPAGVAYDAVRGRLYVSDSGNRRIRMIDASGVVSTFSGNNQLDDPAGLALDGAGNLYVADREDHRILSYTPSGTMTVIAGVKQSGHKDGPATQARFKAPEAVAATAAGVIYVADTGNDVIRRISLPSGGVRQVTTIAGRSQHDDLRLGRATPDDDDDDDGDDDHDDEDVFDRPSGIGIDAAGNLIVADTKNHRIRLVNLTTTPATVTTIAGKEKKGFKDGAPLDARFDEPSGIAVQGAVYIADTKNDAIRVLYAGIAAASVTPNRGPVAGGTPVRILGSGFVAGATEVKFGSNAATNVVVESAGELTAVTPAGSAGSVNVAVTTGAGTATIANGFTYLPAPVITAFTPLSGFPGTVVTITGQNFDPIVAGNAVTLGGSAVVVTSATATELVFTVPTGAATGRISVTTAGGTATSSADFVVPVLTDLAIAPPLADLNAGDTLQLVASATYSDGTIIDVTAEATWSSSDDDVATVSPAGLVTAVGEGEAVVTASFGGIDATATITVTAEEQLPPDPALVAPPIDPTKISNLFDTTSFLYTGPDPIQRDVAPGAIERLRAAVIRGAVRTRDGAPLPGVRVTIGSHPELGHTLTRLDGRFDLAVNGGGSLLVQYAKEGHIAADRYVDVPWNRFVDAPDVVLVPYDTAANAIAFGSGIAQVARGNPVTDEDGTRQATLIFQPGTTASMTVPGGGTQPLTTATLRATELSVGPSGPDAMPALLPPQSGYTYCVELSADEAVAADASRVTFDTPAALYVENFLDFPAGGDVPIGYYDRACARWVASPNGRIVQIVSITDGRAYLDVDGDGLADDSDALLGTTIAEREKLATLYAAGDRLWRSTIPHLTPWDCNWPYGPPDDAEDPPGDNEPEVDEPDDCSSESGGSIIECEGQALGEEVTLAGTPFSLSYNSSRVPGRTNPVQIDVTGDFVPASVKRVEVTANIGGQQIQQSLPPTPGQSLELTWNKRDPYGRDWQGTGFLNISVKYVYPAVYREPAQFAQSFAKIGRSAVIGSRGSSEIGAARTWYHNIPNAGSWDARGAGFGAWTLDVHQIYDHSSNTLQQGTGRRRAAVAGSRTVNTLATGPGPLAGIVSQSLRTSAVPEIPARITTGTSDAAGNLYIGGEGYVWRIARGTTTPVVIAGNGTTAFNGDNIPATSAGILPSSLHVHTDGGLYIADEQNRRLRLVKNGLITTVAGNGDPGVGGDDVPAAASPLTPRAVAITSDGTIYITDREHSVIRAVDPCSGLIWTVLTGESGGGDVLLVTAEGIAPAASTMQPTAIVVGPTGDLYFTAEGNSIHRLTPSGDLTLIQGPEVSCEGYGCFPEVPGSLLFVGENLYFTKTLGNTIYSIVGTNAPKLFGGNGAAGFAGDGGFAGAASFNQPRDLFVDPEGQIIVVDEGNQALRALKNPYPGMSDDEQAVAAPNGGSFFVFNADGRHLRTVDAMLGVTQYSFGYSADGYLTSITDSDGNVTTIERSGGVATAIVAPGSQRTTFGYNADGYLTSITDGRGTLRFEYDEGGLLTAMVDRRSNRYEYTYDSSGRLIRNEDPAGGRKTLTRSGRPSSYEVQLQTIEGRGALYRSQTQKDGTSVRSIVEASGLETRIERNQTGTTTIFTPDGQISMAESKGDPRFSLQAPFTSSSTLQLPNGGFLTTTQSRSYILSSNPSAPVVAAEQTFSLNGRSYTTTFDASSRTVTKLSPAGRSTVDLYDARGRLIRTEVPGLLPIQYGFDSRGRLTTITQGARAQTMDYDSRNRPTRIVDSLSGESLFTYDDADRLLTATMPGGHVISYDYDGNSNTTAIQPPGRPDHTFAFNAVDQASSYVAPGVAAETLTYDGDHALSVFGLADGRDITYARDSAGRATTIAIERGDYTFGWSSSTGTLDSITAPDGSSTSFSYAGSILEGTTFVTGPITAQLSFGYDGDNRVSEETISCGTTSGTSCDTVNYTYDDDDMLRTAGLLTLTRDPGNGLLSATTAGSISDAFEYNGHGEVTRHTATATSALFSEELTRDSGGRITRKVVTVDGTTDTYDYTYAPSRELATVRKNGVEIASYTWDGNGNRLTRTTAGGTETATYGDDDRILTQGTATYVHSAAGQLQSVTDAAGTTSFTYDELGNLLGVTLPGGDEVEYQIDGENRRVARLLNGAVLQRFVYVNPLQIGAELDPAGNIVSRFVYGTRPNVPDLIVRTDGTYRIITDHLGSPRVVVNVTTGAVVQRMDFDEFGRVLLDSNPGFQPFGFAGGIYDADTGLVRFGNRDYDPRTGRWTAKDPIGFNGGDSNLYAYVFGDPINNTDPWGLYSWDEFLQDAANFSAGFGDSLTFGLTDWIRDQMGTNDVVDKCSGAYKWGERAEIGFELASMGASAALKGLARGAARREVYNAARRATRNFPGSGGQVHHINPLFGHPGGGSTLFPTGGLPASIHSGSWNLQRLSRAEHIAAHQRLRRMESAARTAVNPGMTGARAARNAAGDCGCP